MTLTSKQTVAKLFRATPILRVSNIQKSIEYYVDILGFKLDWSEGGGFVAVSRDRCCIFLCEGGQGNPGSWMWIGAEDVEPLFEELKLKGAKMRIPPTNYPWAYEVHIEDLDGNILRFGSDRKDGEPFGDWIDMHGQRWSPGADGEWVKS